jgi:hypothetical protein
MVAGTGVHVTGFGQILALVACSPVGDPRGLSDPGRDRDGLDGRDGPFGAAVVELDIEARVIEVIPTLVVYPATKDLEPAVEGAPVVAFTHDIGVAPERYLWLARHFATRGYVTVLPEAAGLLPTAQPGNAELALAGVREVAAEDALLSGVLAQFGPVARMGHGVGGAVSARSWTTDDSAQLLAMLAAAPPEDAPVEGEVDRPSVSVVGANDPEAAAIGAAALRFPEPTAHYVLAGMTHFAWTEDATEGELERDGPLTRNLDETRVHAQGVLDAFLDVHLISGDPSAIEGPFSGTLP